MRLFLLLALLLRLAPAPALAEAHCAGEATGISAASHAHHDAPPADAPESDCSHCPPSECANQQGCTAAPATLAVTPTASAHFGFPVTRYLSRAVSTWQSVTPAPPVPPPVIPSA